MKAVTLILLCTLILQAEIKMQKIKTKKLDEASGLLVSRRYPDVLWSHNDSGDKSRLYALDRKTLKLIKKIKVKKAANRDWEDLTYYRGNILIGDFGNNKNRRKDLTIYTIKEPNPYKEKKIRPIKRESFIFSDQKSSKYRRKNFDCEAMFSFDDKVYLLTKHRADTDTTLYLLKKHIAQKISDYTLDDRVTSADSDGKIIAILTYKSIYIVEPKGKKNLFEGRWRRKKLDNLGQIEGVALDGDMVHIVSEEGMLYSLHVSDIK